jgi:tetratricopeptide (TPR) repeat protein
LAEAAARARADLPAPRLAVANALKALGRHDEAADSLEATCRRHPENAEVRRELALLLAEYGREDEALLLAEAAGRALWALKLRFKLLMRAGRLERARELEPALSQADPADAGLLEFQATAWRQAPGRRLAAAEAALAHDPAAMHAIHAMATALAELGRGDEARGLMGLESLVNLRQPPVPPGFGSGAEFAAALAAEILRNPTLHADPAGHATRQGLRTAAYPLPGDEAGTALLGTIRGAIEAYAGALAGPHPFVTARPREARFKAWALIFRDEGRQALHHHPGPWLTGVYYVTAPAGGALRIGGMPESAAVAPPWPVLEIEPAAGTLVLFPSYVPHETLPTGRTEPRISVAFDVAPAG